MFIGLGTANAATVIVTDADGNTFGDTAGFALDFDRTTGLSATYTPALVNAPYFIDNVTVFNGDSSTGTVFLGVYTTFSSGTLSGFQGVSTNTVTLDGLARSAPLSFDFSGLTVTPEMNPGSGGDVRFFVFQTGTEALTTYTNGVRVPIRRIDGAAGSFDDELSAIINSSDGSLQTSRSAEYTATLTLVPEPSVYGLLGIAGAILAARRSRLS